MDISVPAIDCESQCHQLAASASEALINLYFGCALSTLSTVSLALLSPLSIHPADQLTNEEDLPDEFKPQGARVVKLMVEVPCKRNHDWASRIPGTVVFSTGATRCMADTPFPTSWMVPLLQT